ncbi:hypothetical protein PG991_012045 [Apiospora marii]|uniref:Uncharacterized protein n=1 Tax=Apiospora marii TaxID=335849 RepID=A0ABR1RFW8_9PEZI
MKLSQDGGRLCIVEQGEKPAMGQLYKPAAKDVDKPVVEQPHKPAAERNDKSGAEQAEKPDTQHRTPGRFAFVRSVPSKLPKFLSRSLASQRSSTVADNASSVGTKEGTQQYSEEQEKESPPPYSSISTAVPDVPYYPGRLPGDTSLYIESGDPKLSWPTFVPFDMASFGTLAPIHPAMPYHLAFYHVHSTCRTIEEQGWATISSFVPPFSCSGTVESPIPNSPICRWSSELYFSVEYLQKQEISYVVYLHNADPEDLAITMCPHITVSLTQVMLRPGQDVWPRASAHIRHTERLSEKQKQIVDEHYRHGTRLFSLHQHGKQAENISWDSDGGRLGDLHSCKVCHCDLERSLEVRGLELHVRFTVYRNLGRGLDRYDPKWRSLLTGEGHPRPPRSQPESYYGVYQQVMRVAHELDRPNLHPVTFRTPHGDFWVPKDTISTIHKSPYPITIKGNPKLGHAVGLSHKNSSK